MRRHMVILIRPVYPCPALRPLTRQSSQRHKSYTDEELQINLSLTDVKRAHNLPLMWVPFRCDFDKIHQTETPSNNYE